MIISVANTHLGRQTYPTSCWISTSHFVLKYLGVQISLSALHAEFYNPDSNSILLMNGAGHPKRILSKYAFDAGRFPDILNPQVAPKQQVVTAIADNIRENIPVIAAIRTQQIRGFGHAVLITAIDPATGTLAFKDPATGTTPRSFGVDVRSAQYEEFINGLSYRYHNSMHQNITTYCTQITYLRPINEMSLLN